MSDNMGHNEPESNRETGHGKVPVVASSDAAPIAYKGVPVMTTGRLAAAYETDEKVLQNNYSRNQVRFKEGVHLFKIVGKELRDLKTDPLWEGQFDKRAPALILWTERGARRHAKILDNDIAWSVFEELEDTYFAVKEERAISAKPAPRIAVAPVFKDFFSIGRLIGMDRNQAALGASRATRHLTGIDPLEMLGAQQLVAPQQEDDLSPTDIGVKLGGKSGIAVNNLLAQNGFQTGWRDSKNRPHWEPTDKGKPFAVWKDTAKKHSDGTPVRQLRWSAGIIRALETEIGNAKAVG
ncbi:MULTISPECIES: ORF6N domain-containing protein [Azospirillum]|nr:MULTISPECIES: ORF6N domain-containing protein [Azospirillum]MDW7555373.1 ORF6N domain-containing protein [Azospirillum brasilense]MDW7595219.1 ORF6N domain-containing protein [Azospirillum brasilense]MDW7630372.1 ORF6N domain-containing protein [Azospirillum brasilense]MDX5949740.1 ORF6N domain-containing protein [Azospirillum brasilense]TVZ67393.1 ORF6N domain-containing protein [Azospirillum brasilense]